jgi:transmembrane sensor
MLDRFFASYQSGLSDGALPNDPLLQQEIFQEIQTRIGSNVRRKKRKVATLWLPLAAVISLFVLAYFFTDRLNLPDKATAALSIVEQRTSPGQKVTKRLPDGTIVYLNADSKISYSKNFGEDIREVTLTGEAYFEVVKNGKPFVVHADKTRTEVLGTSFNVKNRTGDRVEVTLVEGKVNVIAASGSSSILNPNQRAVVELSSGKIVARPVDILPYISWKDNILFFDQTSLREAVAALETWYGVTINIVNPALEQCVITAKYQNEPLANVLSSFQFLLNLNISRLDERHYTINGQACK